MHHSRSSGDKTAATRSENGAAESPCHVDHVVLVPNVAGFFVTSDRAACIFRVWGLSVRSSLSRVFPGSEPNNVHNDAGDSWVSFHVHDFSSFGLFFKICSFP